MPGEDKSVSAHTTSVKQEGSSADQLLPCDPSIIKSEATCSAADGCCKPQSFLEVEVSAFCEQNTATPATTTISGVIIKQETQERDIVTGDSPPVVVKQELPMEFDPLCDQAGPAEGIATHFTPPECPQFQFEALINPGAAAASTSAELDHQDFSYFCGDNIQTGIQTDEKPYKCKICDYQSKAKGNVKKHMLTHSGEKPYKCEQCEYQTSNSSNLKMHMSVHSEKKTFQCTSCNYQCTHIKSLRRHMLTHTGAEPYKCDVCPYQTIFQGNLKKHKLRHTGEKPYKCEKCDYQSSNGSNLKMHMNTHLEKKTYECGVCKYQCKHIKSLQRHFKKHAEVMSPKEKV